MELKKAQQPKNILLIEDNFEIRDNIYEMLLMENHHVLLASNGEEGLELAKIKLPDLILCDIVMPNLTGLEVFIELKKNKTTCNIPFVFITASVEKKEVEEAVKLGADGYIFKPFELEEITSKISTFFV